MKIEKRIVNKEMGIVQITCPDERWYQVRPDDDRRPLTQDDFYPSVTWIASYYPKTIRYMRWLAEKGWDKAEEIKNLAAEKGSRVHHACEDLLLGNEVKIDSKYPDSEGETKELTAEEYGVVMTFKSFLEAEQPIILGTEYTILNHEHKFGGTVDIKCRIKSDDYKFVHIIDIKTSQEIWPSHEIQLSAYKETEAEVQKIDILQVGYNRNKNGWKLTEIEPQFDLFLAAKRIWQKEQGNVLVPQKEYPLSLKWTPAVIKPAYKTSTEELLKNAQKSIAGNSAKKVVRRKIIRKKK